MNINLSTAYTNEAITETPRGEVPWSLQQELDASHDILTRAFEMDPEGNLLLIPDKVAHGVYQVWFVRKDGFLMHITPDGALAVTSGFEAVDFYDPNPPTEEPRED